MRTETVEINGKKIEIKEKRNRELQDMVKQFKTELSEVEIGENANSALMSLFDFLKDKLLVLFPELTDEDLLDAYPSEIESLIEAFVTVNFTGIRKVWEMATGITSRLMQAASTPQK